MIDWLYYCAITKAFDINNSTCHFYCSGRAENEKVVLNSGVWWREVVRPPRSGSGSADTALATHLLPGEHMGPHSDRCVARQVFLVRAYVNYLDMWRSILVWIHVHHKSEVLLVFYHQDVQIQ